MQKAIDYLIKNDKVMFDLYKIYGVPYIPSRPEGFETLCKLIIEQQVSLESAKACFLNLEKNIGAVTPENILKYTEEEIRTFSISRQKASYLKALSEAVTNGTLDISSLSAKNEGQVRKELIQIKGIGNWTIDIYLMFSLQSPNIIPLGDIAIVNTIKELFNCTTTEEIEKISNNWKPYNSMASFFLWHHYLAKRNRKPVIY
jgi:DNA-3-methyladenine glycosylase II